MTKASELSPAVQAELADMILAMANNPETRKDIAKAAKKAGIPYKFNDIEAEETAVVAARKAAKEELEEDRAERQKQDITRRLEAQRSRLVKSESNPDGRFDEKTIKEKIEPFMQEKGIADYEDAAILYAHANPVEPSRPEIAQRGMWTMPEGDWQKDSAQMARVTAHKAIHDIMQARR